MDKQDQHIASVYDRDLEGIQAAIMKMGGKVEQAIHDAARALVKRDLELAETVRLRDKDIDQLDSEINEDVVRVIALRAPMGSDLRTVISVMKVSANLERVGDYAKNMAKRTMILADASPVEGTELALQRMTKEVENMLQQALDAYIRRDADLAQTVREMDEEVDQMYNALFREFLTHMMEDPRNISVCMHMHFMAKNIERMGDHVTSIAEQVIFLTTGEMPEDERPKADNTSTEGTLS